jgi:hypothetical protein
LANDRIRPIFQGGRPLVGVLLRFPAGPVRGDILLRALLEGCGFRLFDLLLCLLRLPLLDRIDTIGKHPALFIAPFARQLERKQWIAAEPHLADQSLAGAAYMLVAIPEDPRLAAALGDLQIEPVTVQIHAGLRCLLSLEIGQLSACP